MISGLPLQKKKKKKNGSSSSRQRFGIFLCPWATFKRFTLMRLATGSQERWRERTSASRPQEFSRLVRRVGFKLAGNYKVKQANRWRPVHLHNDYTPSCYKTAAYSRYEITNTVFVCVRETSNCPNSSLRLPLSISN